MRVDAVSDRWRRYHEAMRAKLLPAGLAVAATFALAYSITPAARAADLPPTQPEASSGLRRARCGAGAALHGSDRASARVARRVRRARSRRQRGGRRHRGADGADAGRAAVLGNRRRRLPAALRRRHAHRARLRRPRDRAVGRDAVAVRRPRRSADAASSMRWSAAARWARRGWCACSSWSTHDTEGCHGAACSHRRYGWRATASRSVRGCTRCWPAIGTCAKTPPPPPSSTTRKAAPGRSATGCATRRWPTPCRASPRKAAWRCTPEKWRATSSRRCARIRATRACSANMTSRSIGRSSASPCAADHGRYRVCGMPPPSSGGLAIAQILAYWRAAPARVRLVGADGHLEAAGVHRFTEAARLAFADRNRYVADTDFVALPGQRIGEPAGAVPGSLLDPPYLAARAALIGERSMVRAAPGVPGGAAPGGGAAASDDRAATTHLSIVDARGDAVSMTSSIENAFGCAPDGARLSAEQPADRLLVAARERRHAGGQPRAAGQAAAQFDVADARARALQRRAGAGDRLAGRAVDRVVRRTHTHCDVSTTESTCNARSRCPTWAAATDRSSSSAAA